MVPYGRCVGAVPMPGLPCNEGGSIALEEIDGPGGYKNGIVFFHPMREERPSIADFRNIQAIWRRCLGVPGSSRRYTMSRGALCVAQYHEVHGRLRGLAVLPGGRAHHFEQRATGFTAVQGCMVVWEVKVTLRDPSMGDPGTVDVPMIYIALLPQPAGPPAGG